MTYPKDQSNRHRLHISAQFNAELDAVKNDLLEMGGKVESQIDLAREALISASIDSANSVISIDKDINAHEVAIDEKCARILARRHPAAGDLRLIISITKVTTELERIGDEASKIARLSVELADRTDVNPCELQTNRIAQHVSDMLHRALDAFARLQSQEALAVVLSDSDIDEDYTTALARLQVAMRETPDNIPHLMDLSWALRSLERIGDHASNIAEQVVFLAQGVDIRHTKDEQLLGMLQ